MLNYHANLREPFISNAPRHLSFLPYVSSNTFDKSCGHNNAPCNSQFLWVITSRDDSLRWQTSRTSAITANVDDVAASEAAWAEQRRPCGEVKWTGRWHYVSIMWLSEGIMVQADSCVPVLVENEVCHLLCISPCSHQLFLLIHLPLNPRPNHSERSLLLLSTVLSTVMINTSCQLLSFVVIRCQVLTNLAGNNACRNCVPTLEFMMWQVQLDLASPNSVCQQKFAPECQSMGKI